MIFDSKALSRMSWETEPPLPCSSLVKGCWERGGQAGRGSAGNCSRILASHGAVIYKHSRSRPTPRVKALTSLPCLLAGFLQAISKCASGPL